MFMRWKFSRECRPRVHVMRNKFLLNANCKCMIWDIFVMHEMIFFSYNANRGCMLWDKFLFLDANCEGMHVDM
jgi:hypothetical protein